MNNDAGKTIREIRGCTSNWKRTKHGRIVTVKIGLVQAGDDNEQAMNELMMTIRRVEQRVINAIAEEFLP